VSLNAHSAFVVESLILSDFSSSSLNGHGNGLFASGYGCDVFLEVSLYRDLYLIFRVILVYPFHHALLILQLPPFELDCGFLNELKRVFCDDLLRCLMMMRMKS
jgi:hypothetical protein